MTTYEVRVAHDSDTDIQPTVPSLESALVQTVAGIDTDRVLVTLIPGADAKAYEALLESDDKVSSYRKVAVTVGASDD